VDAAPAARRVDDGTETGVAAVHLRVLTSGDAHWVLEADRQAGDFVSRIGWDSHEKLAAELDEGLWASDERWAWAVVRDGDPIGFALVTNLQGPDAEMQIRIITDARGRGAGREVLRQLADHHFAENNRVRRMTGRTHERNVPMQRAFTAAGFRMEARYRESYRHPDGTDASEWGYALTRADWTTGRHRHDSEGYDLHGRTFLVERAEDEEEGPWIGTRLRLLQEGRRVLAKYDGEHVLDGELAGILLRDVVSYRFVHQLGDDLVRGGGRFRVQRRRDGRFELLDDWESDHHGQGSRTFVEGT
jgi:RimJ/RimL family protein N-acetyltransferase